jgi:hypothetical protein
VENAATLNCLVEKLLSLCDVRGSSNELNIVEPPRLASKLDRYSSLLLDYLATLGTDRTVVSENGIAVVNLRHDVLFRSLLKWYRVLHHTIEKSLKSNFS